MTAEENNRKTEQKAEQEEPRPLTDEEFEALKEKEKRTGGFISMILDFFTGFFH